jgi:hypothetical protein
MDNAIAGHTQPSANDIVQSPGGLHPFACTRVHDLTEYDSQRIRGEWLIVYKTGKGQHWFERSSKANSEEEWAPFSAYFNGPRETWRCSSWRAACRSAISTTPTTAGVGH